MTNTPWTLPAGVAGLIFDCDGTLADTMPAHYIAWCAMLDRYGIPFPIEQFYGLGGMPSERIIRLLAEQNGVVVDDVAAMTRDKEARYFESIDAVQPIGAVVDIAAEYRGRLPLAVASGGERYVVERTLVTIGVADWFQAIVAAEDTERHKPDPDVFLETARRIDVDPAACVVFEDTEFGLEAARRAGMIGVDVRPWNPPPVGVV